MQTSALVILCLLWANTPNGTVVDLLCSVAKVGFMPTGGRVANGSRAEAAPAAGSTWQPEHQRLWSHAWHHGGPLHLLQLQALYAGSTRTEPRPTVNALCMIQTPHYITLKPLPMPCSEVLKVATIHGILCIHCLF